MSTGFLRLAAMLTMQAKEIIGSDASVLYCVRQSIKYEFWVVIIHGSKSYTGKKSKEEKGHYIRIDNRLKVKKQMPFNGLASLY